MLKDVIVVLVIVERITKVIVFCIHVVFTSYSRKMQESPIYIFFSFKSFVPFYISKIIIHCLK